MTGFTCKGCYMLGTACGNCIRCAEQLAKLKKENRQDVTELDLNRWEAVAEDPQHVEIIRLARVGLWAEQNSIEIDEALRVAATASMRAPRRKQMHLALSSRPRR